MANAGYSADNKFVKTAITGKEFLTINSREHFLLQHFKRMINKVLEEDEIKYYPSYNGKKYAYHAAWRRKKRLLIKINQIRMRNWFWEKLTN